MVNTPGQNKRRPEAGVFCAHNGEEIEERDGLCRELIVVTDGSLSIERSDSDEPELHVATDFIEIPQGVRRRIKIHETPTNFVIIYPEPGRRE